eukprot:363154-Chlamydomonas_euryale.AAC.4
MHRRCQRTAADNAPQMPACQHLWVRIERGRLGVWGLGTSERPAVPQDSSACLAQIAATCSWPRILLAAGCCCTQFFPDVVAQVVALGRVLFGRQL